jgi:HSP20 family protein
MSHVSIFRPSSTNLRHVLNRIFDDSLVGLPSISLRGDSRANLPEVRSIPLDIRETHDAYTVSATLPGCDKDAIDIGFAEDVLTIKARVSAPEIDDTTQWLLRERFSGQVQRSIKLPATIDADKAEASYRDGVLTLTLPKAENQKPRTIKVSTN